MNYKKQSNSGAKRKSSVNKINGRKTSECELDWNFVYDVEVTLANSKLSYNSMQSSDKFARQMRAGCLMRNLISPVFVLEKFKTDHNISSVMHQTDANKKLKTSQKTDDRIKHKSNSHYSEYFMDRNLAHSYNTSKNNLNVNIEEVPNSKAKSCDNNICGLNSKSNLDNTGTHLKNSEVDKQKTNCSYTMKNITKEAINSDSIVEKFSESIIYKLSEMKPNEKKIKTSQKTDDRIRHKSNSHYSEYFMDRNLAHSYNTSKNNLNVNIEEVPNSKAKSCDNNICGLNSKSNLDNTGSDFKNSNVDTQKTNCSYTMKNITKEAINFDSIVETFSESNIYKLAEMKHNEKKPKDVDSNEVSRKISSTMLQMENVQYFGSSNMDVSLTDPHALGLPNPGTNRCWFNVSLQVIFGLEDFVRDVECCFEDKKDTVCNLFLKLLRCREQLDYSAFKNTARKMSDELHLVNAMYKGTLQQDAGEFFNNFLNYIKNNCGFLLNPVKNNIEFSIIETYICKGCTRNSIEHVDIIIFLSVVDENGKYYNSIQEALDAYKNSKIMDDCCQTCNGSLTSESVFKKLPRYLFIQLLRYTAKDGIPVKMDKLIIVDEILSLTSRIRRDVTDKVPRNANENLNQQKNVHFMEDICEDESTSTQSEIHYRPVGIIYHEGNTLRSACHEMGCGASKRTTTVVPVTETEAMISTSTIPAIGRRTSAVIPLVGEDLPAEELDDSENVSRRHAAYAQPLAFEVPVSTDSLIRRHPPKRLQRLEDNQLPLTHKLLDERQAEAEQRRLQILNQRVQSAKQRIPRRNFMEINDLPQDEIIETVKQENTSSLDL